MQAQPSALRRAAWWAADYAYAGWRQLAALAPPWSLRGPRATPRAWRDSGTLPEVVLVPGVYEHWTFLRPLGDALAAAGHRVDVVHGLGVNERGVAETSERLRDELARTPPPAAGRVIVAHSKGGLIGKHVMATSDAQLLGMVTVATPFAGSRRARLLRAAAIRAFLPQDDTIVMLGGATAVNGRIVSVFGPYDPHIPEGSALDGATNVLVPTSGHFRPLGARSTHQAVIEGVALLASGAAPP